MNEQDYKKLQKLTIKLEKHLLELTGKNPIHAILICFMFIMKISSDPNIIQFVKMQLREVNKAIDLLDQLHNQINETTNTPPN